MTALVDFQKIRGKLQIFVEGFGHGLDDNHSENDLPFHEQVIDR
jgi:hypothetical protein